MDNVKKYFTVAGAAVALLVLVYVAFNAYTVVDAGEIVVKQSLFTGNLEVWSTSGPKPQMFGTLEAYKKSNHFDFGANNTKGDTAGCLPIRFNDQGTASVCGEVRYDLPEDHKSMVNIHQIFRTMAAIEGRLVLPALKRAVYNSGPLMSSRESASDRRADLSSFIREQSTLGIYEMRAEEKEVEDFFAEPIIEIEMRPVPVKDMEGHVKVDDAGKPIMEERPVEIKKQPTKYVKLVEPVMVDNKPVIAEASAIAEYGLRLYNFTITRVIYDQRVSTQIDAQQAATMAIQTARAEAQKAQQDALTVKAKGEAKIAATKADEERKKMELVTRAEARRAEAEQDKVTAQLKADAVLIAANASAKAKKLAIEADGALELKLKTLEHIHASWAGSAAKQPLVPQIVMGGSNSGTGTGSGMTGVQQMMELLTAKTARDLQVDLKADK